MTHFKYYSRIVLQVWLLQVVTFSGWVGLGWIDGGIRIDGSIRTLDLLVEEVNVSTATDINASMPCRGLIRWSRIKATSWAAVGHFTNKFFLS